MRKTAARLDKKYRASPAVLSEKCIRCFCSCLESHESVPLFSLFSAVMRGNDCVPFLAVSPTPSLSPEEGVWSKIMVTQEQAAKIERKTIYISI